MAKSQKVIISTWFRLWVGKAFKSVPVLPPFYLPGNEASHLGLLLGQLSLLGPIELEGMIKPHTAAEEEGAAQRSVSSTLQRPQQPGAGSCSTAAPATTIVEPPGRTGAGVPRQVDARTGSAERGTLQNRPTDLNQRSGAGRRHVEFTQSSPQCTAIGLRGYAFMFSRCVVCRGRHRPNVTSQSIFPRFSLFAVSK